MVLIQRPTTVNVGGMDVPIESRVRGVSTVTVINVLAVEGDGKEVPMHNVEYWFTEDGELIARRSSLDEEPL